MISRTPEPPRHQASGPTIEVAWATSLTRSGASRPADDDGDERTEDLDLLDLLARFDDNELLAYASE